MAKVTRSLSDSLDSLNTQIKRAVELLRKMPGAERASVDVSDYAELDTGSHDVVPYLELWRDPDGDCRIMVNCYDIRTEELMDSKFLSDYPVSVRIQLCHAIPHLIEEAANQEQSVEEDATAAAQAIEQAVARYGGDK